MYIKVSWYPNHFNEGEKNKYNEYELITPDTHRKTAVKKAQGGRSSLAGIRHTGKEAMIHNYDSL